MLSQIPRVYSYTNPDYLDANRRGEITAEQAQLLGPAREFLTQKFRPKAKLNGVIIIIALGFFLVLQLIGIELTAPLALGMFGLILVVLAIQLGARYTTTRRQKGDIEEDLQGGSIRDAVGVLAFTGKEYRVKLPDGPLHLPFGRGEELAPGVRYRFYFLPASRMVLSVEALEDMPVGAVESGLTATLAEANGFKLSALPANQQGMLAPEQISKLYNTLIAPLIFFLVIGSVLYYQLTNRGYLQGNSLQRGLSELVANLNTGMIVLFVILLIIFLGAVVLLILTVLDILGRSVAAVEGPGYRKISTTTDDDGSKTTRLYYVIAGKRFQVQRPGFAAFEDGLTYRAYFTPRRKVLVNLEVLE